MIASTSVPGSIDEHGVHALLRAVDGADDGGLADAGLLVEHAFDVLGKDVETVRRDDHFLLAALDEQTPLRVALADVAGVQPPVAVEDAVAGLLGWLGFWALGVSARSSRS